MTIEFSLRRRAIHARRLAAVWLGLAVIVLVGTYLSLPFVVNETLNSATKVLGSGSNELIDVHVQIFIMTITALGLFAILFACYLLGRSAVVEIEIAARFNGLADALCLSGSDLGSLEKAVTLLVPKAKYFSSAEILTAKEIKMLADVLKQLK